MKHLIIIATLMVSGIIHSQTNFEKGMQKAFSLWEANKWDEAENMFERIANAESDQWLPHYYIAQMNSLKSWSEKDANVLKAQLDKAQEHLNTAMSISKDNPELLVMQAHVLTNWVAFDGMTYGMKYSGKISELYSKALKIAPDNPRVVSGKAEWDMGSAKYFGQDTAPFCKDLERALELFANFKPESPFHPNWGKERVEQTVAACKE
ncbi:MULTISPECIES: tetratricopeptide repeat protein [Flavobacteriaceae]|jgi:tetratricopeptide (TPR) repeat protein|uniref:Tetratricopeptide repeat protein n=1 Tax=Meridianimaribacter flavus TaxID=571115 RepID=A0ABY2G5P3_9FLAO|nr:MULTISPECIES: hypothetical protein [Flavobacteriaceae]RYH72830.1 hypothetical protein EVU94_11495 [Flavobacteriaceae bacterium 144Ye]TBV25536.1 hypothetical protein DMZ43_11365 [Meridianimaribacter sp. CL38]TDY11812.1 hypothetical protein A8975_1651 [Meridianimaribacter flavus]